MLFSRVQTISKEFDWSFALIELAFVPYWNNYVQSMSIFNRIPERMDQARNATT